jgi:hypothetical protein
VRARTFHRMVYTTFLERFIDFNDLECLRIAGCGGLWQTSCTFRTPGAPGKGVSEKEGGGTGPTAILIAMK